MQQENTFVSFKQAVWPDLGTVKKDEPNEQASKSQTNFVLQDSIDKQVKLLLREKEEDNNAVPRSLVSFIETPKFYNFLLALLEYCRELFRLENKQ